MAYSKTWDTDSPNYNAFTERAIDKVETQLEGIWNTGVANTFTLPSRSTGTTYTNTTGYPMFICATVELEVTYNALGDGSAACHLEIAGSTICQAELTEPSVPLATVTHNAQLMGVVNDGQTYEIVVDNGSVSLEYIQEFAFDATHTAQTWNHKDLITEAKLNYYADGANRATPKDAPLAYGSSTSLAANASFSTGDKAGLVIYTYDESYSTLLDVGSNVTIEINNDGGGYTSSAALGWQLSGAAEFGGGQLAGAAFVNPNSNFRRLTGGGTFNYRLFPFVAPAYTDISFANGEKGTATGNKFRDLDDRASQGMNVGTDMSYTSHGSVTSISSVAGAWRIGVVTMDLDSDVASAAVGTVTVGGTTVFSFSDAALSTIHPVVTGLFLIPAGDSVTLSASGGTSASIVSVHTWEVA